MALNTAGTFLYFRPDVQPVRQLENEGWRQTETGNWKAPATLDMYHRLLRHFPQVRILESVQWWLEQQEGVAELTRELPCWPRLRDHQKKHVLRLAKMPSALVGRAPGLGKTALALAAAQLAGKRNLMVVCPLTLKQNWAREAGMWWPALAEGNGPRLRLFSYGEFKRDLKRSVKEHGLPDLLIFDESVLLKNRKAQRTVFARQARAWLNRLRQKRFNERLWCWELSGSPAARFYDDLFAQLQVMEPEEFKSYWRWTRTYCLLRREDWGDNVVANVPNSEVQLQRQLRHIYLPFNYNDLAREYPQEQIPEWEFELREVPLPPDWWQMYRQMKKQFLVDLPTREQVLAPNKLVQLLRLQQLVSNPMLLSQFGMASSTLVGGKTDPALLRELLEEVPGPTILWTQFIETAEALHTALKAPVLTGMTPVKERDPLVQRFQAGELPLLIAHPGVGRFGLTITRARTSIYVERSYDGDAFYQSLHRIRRLGTVEPPHVVLLLACGPQGQRTVDHLVHTVLGYRANNNVKLTTTLVRRELEDAD